MNTTATPLKTKTNRRAHISWNSRVFIYIFLIGFTLLTLFPIGWLFMSSLKEHKEIVTDPFAFPTKIFWNNFLVTWEIGNFGIYLINSIIYTVISSLLTVYIAMSMSYGFIKFKFRISRILNLFIMAGLLITVHAVLIPLFLMETQIGIANSRLGIILPYVAFGLPFNIYLAGSYIRGIPNSLIEAGIMDGASHIKIFHQIILPFSRPIIFTMLIFTMLANWNEFVFVFVLTSEDSIRSLPVGINSFAGGMARNFGYLFAALVIGIIPMLVFYVLFYQKIIDGASVSGGSLKE